ncbi:hypothetical protein Fmac_030005 [Flemingia macrophylla]|uniref:RING-type E3 ubiquitin transferase n=1 Tax=Flemingia macrophylla TaxID=520843 RepID=A0ABD1LC35_9FABA
MALNHNPSYKLLHEARSPTIILHTPQRASDSASVLPLIVPTIFLTAFILITYLTHHSIWSHGLDESSIREIPTFEFTKGEAEKINLSVCGCVVCLNEFQDHDMLRVLPKCKHAFHLHCIEVWLRTNAQCPLCRSSIISGNKQHCPQDHFIAAPSSSPQDSQLLSCMDSDEDFVVIELGEHVPQMQQERSGSRERILGERRSHYARKCHHVSIMGDECIDVRNKDDEQFSIQPIRRFFSMDSAHDRQVYLDFQSQMQQNNRP